MKVQCVWVHYHLERDLANALLVAQPYTLIISFNNSGMSLHNIMDVAWDKGDRSLINLYRGCSWLHGNFASESKNLDIKITCASHNVYSFYCGCVTQMLSEPFTASSHFVNSLNAATQLQPLHCVVVLF